MQFRPIKNSNNWSVTHINWVKRETWSERFFMFYRNVTVDRSPDKSSPFDLIWFDLMDGRCVASNLIKNRRKRWIAFLFKASNREIWNYTESISASLLLKEQVIFPRSHGPEPVKMFLSKILLYAGIGQSNQSYNLFRLSDWLIRV